MLLLALPCGYPTRVQITPFIDRKRFFGIDLGLSLCASINAADSKETSSLIFRFNVVSGFVTAQCSVSPTRREILGSSCARYPDGRKL